MEDVLCQFWPRLAVLLSGGIAFIVTDPYSTTCDVMAGLFLMLYMSVKYVWLHS